MAQPHPAAPGPDPPFTVANNILICGVDSPILFNTSTQAQRIAEELFDNDFSSCMDKTSTELDEELKSYSSLTVTNGQIRLAPGVKRNIRAFIQWVRDKYRLGEDPTQVIFDVNTTAVYIKRMKHHDAFIHKSKTLIETAKPEQFSEKMKWSDWYPTLINFLRAIPGRTGVPLSYVCRPVTVAPRATYADFIDEYVDRAPLTGEAFVTDAAEVHIYIIKFTSGNAVAEAKMIAHAHENDGRQDFIALQNHYEGVGVHAINIIKADKIINDLFYAGEKPPHMWWDEFERQLTDAFNAYDRIEKRTVHSNEMKLRILNRKITADFLQATKASINLELARVPVTMTYENALAAFRNQVNQKNPPDVSSAGRRTRRINEISSRGGGRGGGRGGRASHYGRGRGGRGRFNNGRGSRYGSDRSGYNGRVNNRKGHQDARMVRGLDGTQMEVHPAYDFSNNEWFNLPDAERRRISDERARYKRARTGGRNGDNASIAISDITTNDAGGGASVENQLRTLYQRVSAMESDSNTGNGPSSSMMGGRNEQASLRSRNGDRSVRKVMIKISSQTSTEYKIEEPDPGTSCPNEMDSNADTCCLGANFRVLRMTQRTADVYPYYTSYEPLCNVPIVTGATLFTDPHSGKSIILVINEALYYGKRMDHSLINPNQLRSYGTDVWDNPFDPMRHINIETEEGNIIELQPNGTKLEFYTRAPSPTELATLPHVQLTSIEPWNPREVQLGKVTRKGDSEVSYFTLIGDDEKGDYHYKDPGSDESVLHSISSILTNLGTNLKRMISSEIVTPQDDIIPSRRTFISHSRHSKATAETIAELWGIGVKRAMATMKATTQRGTRSAILPLSRRYRADRYYSLKRLDAKFATDTLYSDIKSLNQNTCAQIFSHKVGFSAVYPSENATGDSIGQSYIDFCHDFGVPEHLTFDGATNQSGKGTLFMKSLNKYGTRYHISSPRRPNENPAEGSIRELKKRWYRIMMKNKVPERLWDFGFVWTSETGNLMVTSSRYAKGRTAIEYITGETPDISEYLDFTFYDWVTYKANAGLGEEALGRWLGVSHKVGQLMSYWILTISCHVISCVTVQRLTRQEKATDEWAQRMKEYDEKILKRLDAKDIDLTKGLSNIDRWNKLSVSDEDPDFIEDFNKVISDESIPNGPDDVFHNTVHDSYVNMEIGLPRGSDDALMHAVVKRRRVDDDGNVVGIENSNPLLDTREYEIEYADGTIEIMTANIIAENLLAQVDEEGHRQLLLDEIIDHRTNPLAVSKEDAIVTSPTGMKRRKKTTAGWELCVQWKDGSFDWVQLKDLKQSYPVDLADYAKSAKIHDEPAFAWWIPFVEKKREVILSKVKTKYWQRTHKYGIRMPKSVGEAYELDRQNGNTLWADGIKEEMAKVRTAVKESEVDPEKLIGYQEIDLHMIFDIKLGENFRRKARMVAGGHKTKPPSSVTYSSVVSRDSVRICLLIAALNELDLQSADIENAYLTAPCREKVWTRAGPEFGTDEGKVMIITRALYGLKSSGAAFRAFLAERLDEMGFKSSKADPDVWMRPHTKPDGEAYYEYVLVYVDDLLAISIDATSVIREVAEQFKLKNDKITPPDVYLGGRLVKKNLNGREVWTMSSIDYVKAIVKNLEERLGKTNRKLPSRATTPMSSDYRPELDGTAELEVEDVTMYQELIGELRWATEIGRVDILHEVSVLSSYQACPREGHLEQIFHIFSYMKKNPKLTLYFDPSLPNIDPATFVGSTPEEFSEQYRDAKEEIPFDMPRARGRFVIITAFVDAAHASDKRTRKSHTGYVIFVNRAPIIFYSKRQSTVESSTFSSEFIALKTCTESIIALRFKLRMFGVPIDGPAMVLNDNQSTVNNSSKLESTLNKKHSSIAYHLVRHNVAAGVVKIGWINTNDNIADPFTKRLTEAKRSKLFGDWTY